MPLTKATQNVVEGIVSTGSTGVSAGSFQVGQQYKITSLGTTTQSQWNTIAGTTGQTYVVGSLFTAATTGASSGNGAAAVARTLANRFADVVNVLDFGAVGDGVADDGPAIQAAINYATTKKASISFTGQTFLIKTAIEIKSNVSLIGNNQTVLFVDKSCSTGLSIGGGPRCIYTNINTSNVFIYGIVFQSEKVGLTKTVSVCFQDVSNLKIERCQFIDFGNSTYYSQGLVVFGGENISIVNNTFSNNSGDGFALSDGSQNFEFIGNTCENNSDWGAAFTNLCANGTVANNLFLNNTSTGTGADECTNVIFSGNISNFNEHGIRIARFGSTTGDQKYFSIVGNICNGNQFGISLEQLSTNGHYSCSGNSITFSANQGIRITNSTFGTINGNQISSSGAEGILFNADTSNTGNAVVSGNYIAVCNYGIRQIQSGTGVTERIVVSSNDIDGFTIQPIQLTNANFIDSNSSSLYTSTNKVFNFPSGVYSGTATSGGASLPANPWGFMPIYLGGNEYKIPLYNV